MIGLFRATLGQKFISRDSADQYNASGAALSDAL